MYPPHMTCMYPPPHMTCTDAERIIRAQDVSSSSYECMYPPPHMTCTDAERIIRAQDVSSSSYDMHVSSSSYDMHRCRAHYQSSRCLPMHVSSSSYDTWHACILLLIRHMTDAERIIRAQDVCRSPTYNLQAVNQRPRHRASMEF